MPAIVAATRMDTLEELSKQSIPVSPLARLFVGPHNTSQIDWLEQFSLQTLEHR